MADIESPLFNTDEFGRRCKAARILAGCRNVSDAVELLAQHGVQISTRALYALERGQTVPSVPLYFAMTVAYDPPGGLAYWEPAFSTDAIEFIHRRLADGTR